MASWELLLGTLVEWFLRQWRQLSCPDAGDCVDFVARLTMLLYKNEELIEEISHCGSASGGVPRVRTPNVFQVLMNRLNGALHKARENQFPHSRHFHEKQSLVLHTTAAIQPTISGTFGRFRWAYSGGLEAREDLQ
ncbi:hypothetical protein M758_6G066900 [Ceratodon purpureus]|nr:hypothetical protein M758_6G066900 [Ceratodon purpureus]